MIYKEKKSLQYPSRHAQFAYYLNFYMYMHLYVKNTFAQVGIQHAAKPEI